MENVEKLNHYDGAEVIERFNIEKQSECVVLDDCFSIGLPVAGEYGIPILA